MTFEIKLEAFEGPMDLLLHLIDKNKVDIYDIPIVTITDQYIEYIDTMRVKDMDIMSSFLLMAATLLSIKSKLLLPTLRDTEDSEEEDPRMELIERLVEYKAYKEMSIALKDMQTDASCHVYRKKSLPKEVAAYKQPVDVSQIVGDLSLNKLNKIFQDVLKRADQRKDSVRSGFGRIKKEEISLEQKVISLREYAREHKRFTFSSLFIDTYTKMDIIITFLALLELMKSGCLYIAQERLFDDIVIENKAA